MASSFLNLKVIISAAVFAGTAAMASSTSAATLQCTAGSGGNATRYLLADASAAFCASGNDTNTIDTSYSIFGTTGWLLAAKNDGAGGDGKVVFSTAPINGAASGSWAITAMPSVSSIFISLKASSSFGAFLLDLTDATPFAGTWATQKVSNGNGRDLSHASIYYKPTDVPAVPLPAGGLLLLSGLAGLLVSRYRRAA